MYAAKSTNMQWRIQGGSMGSAEPPLFVVLRACVAGLVDVHSQKRWTAPFQNPRSAALLMTNKAPVSFQNKFYRLPSYLPTYHSTTMLGMQFCVVKLCSCIDGM